MAEAIVTILGSELRIPCAERHIVRMSDLAADLERRLKAGGVVAGQDIVPALAVAALQLMAENQAVGAALARAHAELDQLNDLLLERGAPPAARAGLETAAERS